MLVEYIGLYDIFLNFVTSLRLGNSDTRIKLGPPFN